MVYIKRLTIILVLLIFLGIGSVSAANDSSISDFGAIDVNSGSNNDLNGLLMGSSIESSLDNSISTNDNLVSNNDDMIISNNTEDSNFADSKFGNVFNNSKGVANSIFDDITIDNTVDMENANIEDVDNYINPNIKSNSAILKIGEIIGENSSNGNTASITPQYIKIKDWSYYNSSASIQKIIDNASPGSTIEFMGAFYKNLCLKINKPLNIISKVHTVINGSFESPVFNISKGGSGTNISGFVINSAGSFIEANKVSNINIFKNKVSVKGTAILFNEVFNSKIQYNQFLRFKIALDISKSGGLIISKNNITPNHAYNIGINLEECNNLSEIKIIDNIIKGYSSKFTSTGIYVGENVANLLIKGNSITDWHSGIRFANSVNKVNVTNNTITHNMNGVIISGWLNGFVFKKNVVSSNAEDGVLFDTEYLGSKTQPVIENNFFERNGAMNLRSPGKNTVTIGKNFADPRFICQKVLYKHVFSIKFRQNGGKLFMSVIDEKGVGVTDLPDFSTTLYVDGKPYTVNFRNGIAYIETTGGTNMALQIAEDSRGLSDWGEVISVNGDQLKPYIDRYMEYINQNNPTPQDPQLGGNIPSGHNNPNSTYQGNGSSSGSSEGFVSTSSTSYSAGSSSSGYSDSSSSANVDGSSASKSSPQESVTAKTLSVDEEQFRVVGVGGLVLLIILSVGLYYRDDIKDLLKNN